MERSNIRSIAVRGQYANEKNGRVYPLARSPRSGDWVFSHYGWWEKNPVLDMLKQMDKLFPFNGNVVLGQHASRGKVVYLTTDPSAWIATTKKKEEAHVFKNIQSSEALFSWALTYAGSKTLFFESA